MLNFLENPILCSCDSQELWEWLRDHQKLVERANTRALRCEHPPELRGRIFLDLNPEQFCDQPLVIKLGIQDIQPFSVLVSWQSRNHSGLHGYQVAYYSINGIDEVRIYHVYFINVCLFIFHPYLSNRMTSYVIVHHSFFSFCFLFRFRYVERCWIVTLVQQSS